ncbi:MAG: hypothetical protein EBX41_01035 [Chitinophagia bacterium]|nr:hypothetical protein [Chitinophagia bacterium]
MGLLITAFVGCEKNNLSEVPVIYLTDYAPKGVFKLNKDTAYYVFNFTDGDADILSNDTFSAIYISDSRFDSFIRYDFPYIDDAIRDPKKGFKGTCLFYITPSPVPRPDSLHIATGDTLQYEFYITDKAGHQSNHIITNPVILKP